MQIKTTDTILTRLQKSSSWQGMGVTSPTSGMGQQPGILFNEPAGNLALPPRRFTYDTPRGNNTHSQGQVQ